jgi:hypothetical protein
MSRNTTRMLVAKWGRDGGLVVALICIIMAGVACGPGQVSQFSTLIPTVINTATAVPSTATRVPTLTSIPTSTATRDPARIFADPIFSRIANRLPDIQDDFSSPDSGWDTGRQNDETFVGTRNYIDGQYVMVADPASSYQIKALGYNFVTGYNHRLVSGLKDYVFEVEQTWIQGSGPTAISLHDDMNDIAYRIGLNCPDRSGDFWLLTPITPSTSVQFTNNLLFPFDAATQSRVRITFIIQGQEFAIFADGEPVYYSNLGGARKLNFYWIEFGLMTGSSTTPFEIHWDNLKIWDLNPG